MVESDIFQTVERRAFDARRNMTDVCMIAGVAHSTWCRAKKRGWIRAKTIERIEGALDFIERQRAEAAGG